jgi:hypothetical protein
LKAALWWLEIAVSAFLIGVVAVLATASFIHYAGAKKEDHAEINMAPLMCPHDADGDCYIPAK